MIVPCAQCAVWEPEPNMPEWGLCKRHAPSPRVSPDATAFVGPANNRAFFAYTRGVDGCYEGICTPRMMPAIPKPVPQAMTPDKTDPENPFNAMVKKAMEKVK